MNWWFDRLQNYHWNACSMKITRTQAEARFCTGQINTKIKNKITSLWHGWVTEPCGVYIKNAVSHSLKEFENIIKKVHIKFLISISKLYELAYKCLYKPNVQELYYYLVGRQSILKFWTFDSELFYNYLLNSSPFWKECFFYLLSLYNQFGTMAHKPAPKLIWF